ncbi:MAG: hypothetical protein ABIF09_12515 [Gemmatimonadota bacterium]
MASRLSTFLVELKRRKVYHVAVVYVVVGFGVASGAQYVFEMAGFGIEPAQIVAILVILGFPIALVLAWAYEVRPEELRKVEEGTEGLAEVPIAAERQSIVVLPFDNMSPDPGDAYFSDGLTEEIIASLSHLRALRVISRNSAMVLKGTQKDTRTIARELEVQYVLEGSVRKVGEDLRITAQLIDAASDEHIWSEKYDGVLDDVFGIQETVSRSIVKAMELQILPDEERRLAEKPMKDLQAYECYLRAKGHIWQLSEDSHDRALELIERGLAIAPDSDLLWALKGQIFFHHVDQMNRPPETYPGLLKEARSCADRALAINPSSAPAYELHGLVSQQSADPRGALRYFGRALQLDPNSANAHLLGGFWRAAGGADLERARLLLERVAAIDPLTPMNKGAMGWFHMFEGEFDAALEGWGDWQAEAERVKSPYRVFLAYFHAAVGNLDEAVRLIDQMISDSPQHTLTALGAFLKQAWLGDKGQSPGPLQERIEKALWWDDGWSILVTGGYALLGEDERAFKWLDHAIDCGISNVAFLQEGDPFLRRLRSLEPFPSLMEKAERLSRSLLDPPAPEPEA